MYEILEYVTEDGQIPFREWLDGLKDAQTLARVEVRLNRVRLGNLGDHKSVGQGVSELRIPYGPGYRIYYGRRGSAIVILLHGGEKHSQTRDIALARQYWLDYLRRAK